MNHEETLKTASLILQRLEGRPLAAYALGALCAAEWARGQEPSVMAMWQAEDVYDSEHLREFLTHLEQE